MLVISYDRYSFCPTEGRLYNGQPSARGLACAGSGGGLIHYTICRQPYPIFHKRLFPHLESCKLEVTWQQLLPPHQGSLSETSLHIRFTFSHYNQLFFPNTHFAHPLHIASSSCNRAIYSSLRDLISLLDTDEFPICALHKRDS